MFYIVSHYTSDIGDFRLLNCTHIIVLASFPFDVIFFGQLIVDFSVGKTNVNV